jgi:hypothetical protein
MVNEILKPNRKPESEKTNVRKKINLTRKEAEQFKKLANNFSLTEPAYGRMLLMRGIKEDLK